MGAPRGFRAILNIPLLADFFAPKWPSIWIACTRRSGCFIRCDGRNQRVRVRAFNSRGQIALRTRVDGSVRPGVVAARLDWTRFSRDGGNINVLTLEKLTDMGNAATFYSVCVEVELFRV